MLKVSSKHRFDRGNNFGLVTKSKTKILKIGSWLAGQSAVIIQFPVTPIPHSLVTYEVQKQEFVDGEIWVADSTEHATVLSIPVGWLILTL